MSPAPRPVAALWTLAAHHVRRAWGVSLAIAVSAGLVAAVPLALLSASRYGERAFERFESWSDPPELVVNVCPPGVDPEVDGLDPCFVGVDLEDEARHIAGLDHVRSAVVGGYVFAQGGGDPDPASWGPPIAGLATTGGADSATGRPIVLEGRIAEQGATDELVLTEQAAARSGLGVGDRLHLAAPGADDVVTSTVVGVVRIVDDLLPTDDPTTAAFLVREGWIDANADRVVSFQAVLVQTDEGRADDVVAAISEAFAGQFVNSERYFPADERRNIDHALAIESGALVAVSAVSALAGAAVIAQVVARRSRSELNQAATLRALGATGRFLAGSVVLRWLPVAVGAIAVATVAVALSPVLGPFGVARRAPWSAGPRLDWLVMAAGAVLVPLALVVPPLLTVRRRPVERPRFAATLGPGVVSRVTGTFLRQSFERRSVGSMAAAVLVSGGALAVLLGAGTIATSLDRVIAEPDRFGAPYDALIPAAIGAPEDLHELDGVVGAAMFVGTDVRIGDDMVWVQTTRPVDGVPLVPPVVFEGRAPVTAEEVALAPVTRRDTGTTIGDEIAIDGPDGEPVLFRIVGVAPVTDGYEDNVGLGALFTDEGLARVDPVAWTNDGDVGVRVDPERRDEALAALRAAHPAAFVPFPVPATLQNANRIADLPVLLALGGAVVAGATFLHALLVATRHRRGDLAVLRVLGVVRRQSFAVLTAMAGALALVVVALGGLVGLILGGWGWQLVADSFGVAPAVAYPGLVLVAAPAVVVFIALAASTWPARRASQIRPAEVLRTD